MSGGMSGGTAMGGSSIGDAFGDMSPSGANGGESKSSFGFMSGGTSPSLQIQRRSADSANLRISVCDVIFVGIPKLDIM